MKEYRAIAIRGYLMIVDLSTNKKVAEVECPQSEAMATIQSLEHQYGVRMLFEGVIS